MPTVLLVDDERRIREVCEYALAREGYEVVCATNGNEALDTIARRPIDLVVLDVLMPDLDGLTVCRTLRKSSGVPIIFLSSRGEEVDKLMGLELGADDYITKPFSPRELVMRVKTVLRRSPALSACSKERSLLWGPIEVRIERHEVLVDGKMLTLTATEFAVLAALLERPGVLLSRAQLIERAYTHDNHITERPVDTHIRRIRSKMRSLGVDPIETVHGLGYKARVLSAG